MQIRSSEAIVLRHIDYGEADRIVSLLTLEHGVLKGFARGARKSRKRFGPALEPFAQVSITWKDRGRGDLVSLQESELLDLRTGLRADLVSLALASYGCELVEEFSAAGEVHEEMFLLLKAFLDALQRGDGLAECRSLLELRLLNLVGYIPHLLHCSDCGGGLPEDDICFAAERGGPLCPVCEGVGCGLRVSQLTLGSLSRCLRGPLEQFAGVRFGPRTRQEAEELLRQSLRSCLHRPLKTAVFLDRVWPFPAAGKEA